MVNIKTSKSLEVIRQITVFLIFLSLITPLLLSSKFFFPFISSKVFFFRLIIELALVCYVILAFADKRFRPRITKLSGVVYAYIAIIFVTSLVGLNFYRSFWGNTERGEGIVTFLHVIAFFVILSGLFQDKKQWERFFAFAVLVSVGVSIYATLQRFGSSLVFAGDISRISATIGNASFFGGYLVSHIYLAAWLALRKKGFLRVFFWLVVIYELLVLNATKTRGALLALFLGVLLILLINSFIAQSTRVRRFSAVILLGVVGFGFLVWGLRNSPIIEKTGGLQRVTQISANDVTTESRLLTWQASWEGWQERFFQGYGYENFNVAFNKHFPAEIFRDSGSQIWFDRAHNIFFDVAVSSGFFGIIAYLSLFILSFWALFRFYKRNPEENRNTSVIFFALLLSYFIQNLFVFDTLGTYITFYSVLAFIVFLQTSKEPSKDIRLSKKEKRSFNDYLPAGPNPYLTLALIIVFVSVAYYTVAIPAKANLGVTKALISNSKGDFKGTMDNYKQVITLNNYINEEARQKLAEAMIGFRYNTSVNPEAVTGGFRTAVDELKFAIDASPADARNYLFLMALYNNFPSNEASYKVEVVRLGKEALELSPTRPQIYFEMGQAAFGLGQTDQAIEYFQKAVDLNPEAAESHWNLALAAVLAGRLELGIKEIDYVYDAKRTSKIVEGNLRNMISFLGQQGALAETVRIYETLIERVPNDEAVKEQYNQVLETLQQ